MHATTSSRSVSCCLQPSVVIAPVAQADRSESADLEAHLPKRAHASFSGLPLPAPAPAAQLASGPADQSAPAFVEGTSKPVPPAPPAPVAPKPAVAAPVAAASTPLALNPAARVFTPAAAAPPPDPTAPPTAPFSYSAALLAAPKPPNTRPTVPAPRPPPPRTPAQAQALPVPPKQAVQVQQQPAESALAKDQADEPPPLDNAPEEELPLGMLRCMDCQLRCVRADST